MPGILTGLVTVLTAFTGLYLAISEDGQVPVTPKTATGGRS